MGLFSKIFKKKSEDSELRIGGMEDFMTLIRVYYQAVIAANLGISNIAFLPDLRVFKQTFKVPTVNNKLGIGERSKCRKLLTEMYQLDDNFFKEIDNSIKKNCKNVNDIKNYLLMFQGFSQDLMMVVGNMMQLKLRLPNIFKKAIYGATQKTIHNILTQNVSGDNRKYAITICQYQRVLGYSESWMTDYVYKIVMLAKKEPKPKDDETAESTKK
jgi:hypothetical protein